MRLTEQVVIAGRADEVAQVRQALTVDSSRLVVHADSRDEALAFVLAAIRTGDEEVRKFIESRALVVDSDQAARQLTHRGGLVLGLRAGAMESVGLLLERGNLVILPLGNDAPKQEAIRLRRPSRGDFSEALRTMGFSEEDAERLARECGRSVTILLRRLPSGTRQDPDWLNQGVNRDLLIPALLAGGWDSSAAADRAALEKLARVDYLTFESRLRPLLRVADPPIQQIGSVWSVLAPVDLFEGLAPVIGEQQLQLLKSVCADVLGEIDPAVDLPVDERQYAGLHGKVLNHSSWLRNGLTQTLLLVAVRGDEAGVSCAGGGQRFVDGVIGELPALAQDHRLIASLHGQLPYLMEAAPHPLLSALERLLKGDGERIVSIFTESGLLGPDSYHTGLLWALELLAWDPAYLDRAAHLLGRLAQIDPGGKLSNRPLHSLREIFLPWHPSTNATLGARLRVLDSITATQPEIAWRLLTSLLPSFQGVSTNTFKPLWRDAGATERERLTNGLVYASYRGVVERTLGAAEDAPERWVTIIAAISAFAPEDRDKSAVALEDFARRVESATARFEVWSALRTETRRHRRFSSAKWAMRAEDVGRLEGIVALLEPKDLVDKDVWLFDQHFPDLPNQDEIRDIDAADVPRRDAVLAIIAQDGTGALLRLAQRAKIPGLVAVAAVQAITDLSLLMKILEIAIAEGEPLAAFASVLSGEAARKHGGAWQDPILEKIKRNEWTVEQAATALYRWPDEPGTWTAVADLGADIDTLYWSGKPVWPVKDETAQAIAVTKYIAVGRAVAALETFALRRSNLQVPLIFALLDAALPELASGAIRPSGNFGFELESIFDELEKREDVDRAEIARREYSYLPLLDHHDRKLVLHAFLAQEPKLFVDILSDVYKSASDPKGTEPTKAEINRARNGYRLLQSLRKMPGVSDEGAVDGVALRNWVLRVRELARNVDRDEIADGQIGRLLAYAPQDLEDGAWPHRAVRDVIEEVRSDTLESAIESEQLNKRGVYTKAPFEGGGQERGLAADATKAAKTAQAWPRTSALMRRIASMWEHYAQREDQDAEKDKTRFG